MSSIADQKVTLERKGSMPMPLDVLVTYEDGSNESFHIPLQMMYGHKPTKAKVLGTWSWVNPVYSITTDKKVSEVQIDPKNLMADINRGNNIMKQ